MSNEETAPLSGPGLLLRTKLMPPRRPAALVPRQALLARLDQALSKKLLLVTAPTGFGKTTLVASWLAARDFASAWITLDEGDNDPVRFWEYVVTALRSLEPSMGKEVLAALRSSQPASIQSLLVPLLNELTRLTRACVLVLEDYQAVRSPEVQATLSFFLQNLPAQLHLVLVSRSEPDLSLAILRARDELAELEAASLRFSLEETDAFLRANVRASLPASAAESLHQRTEGWAAGLRLAAQYLEAQGKDVPLEAVIQAFTGEQRYVFDYLIQNVFAAQREEIQTFLLQTCFLNRLTGSLCDAVTQGQNGADLLDHLERGNLFVVRLMGTGGRPWYRYHALFAESLQGLARRRLEEKELHSMFERACAWYEAQGLRDEAVETALGGKLYGHAVDLIEGSLESRGLAEAGTLRRWLDQVPVEELELHPQVSLAQAQALLFASERFDPSSARQVEHLLESAEARSSAGGAPAPPGALHALRSLAAWCQGDTFRAYAYARQALAEIPEEQASYRGLSLLITSREALAAGRIFEAQDSALEARALLGSAQLIPGLLAATEVLGEVFLWQAELERAEEMNRQVLVESAEGDGAFALLGGAGSAALGRAVACYERNDLGAAEGFASQALDWGRRNGSQRLVVRATLLVASLRVARGEQENVRRMLGTLAGETLDPASLREVQDAQALYSLRANETAPVEHWLELLRAGGDGPPRTQEEREAFTLARWQIQSGDPAAALEALARWSEEAARNGRARRQVEALCLEALAHEANADRDRAAQALRLALRIGQEKGLRRIFLDVGPPLAALLQSLLPALPSRALSLYASTLIRSFSAEGIGEQAGANPLAEPLSPQEIRVLRLLARGLSNPEIAQELVVSKNTVKTQVQSIYRKLNVQSRREARAVARDLNLR